MIRRQAEIKKMKIAKFISLNDSFIITFVFYLTIVYVILFSSKC